MTALRAVGLTAVLPVHLCEVRPRKDHRGVDLISDALPFGRLWYGEPNAASNAIRLVFDWRHNQLIMGFRIVTLDVGIGGASAFDFSPARPFFHQLVPFETVKG